MKTLSLLTAALLSSSAFALTEVPGLPSGEASYTSGNICVPSDNSIVYNWGFPLQGVQQLMRDSNVIPGTTIDSSGPVGALIALQKGNCMKGLLLKHVIWVRTDAVPAATQPGQKILDFSLILEFAQPFTSATGLLSVTQTVLIDGAILAGSQVGQSYETKIFSFMIR